MITTVYFVRHAQPDFSVHDDKKRPLTEKGRSDAAKLVQIFADIPVTAVYSSPFKRAIDTVKGIAEAHGLPVITVDNFRERKIDSVWIEDFDDFVRSQWSDPYFKMAEGECLKEVQQRNVSALKHVLNNNEGGCSVIGSHGTALSTIISHFDPSFGYADFIQIKNRMPWIVKFEFHGNAPVIEYIDT